MSQEKIEAVLQMAVLLSRRDFEAALDCFDADSVWEHNVGLGTPMEGVYRGHGDIRGLWRDFEETFDQLTMEIDEASDEGEAGVLVLGRVEWSGGTSGAGAQAPIGMVADVSGGRIRRLRFFLDRSKALALVERS